MKQDDETKINDEKKQNHIVVYLPILDNFREGIVYCLVDILCIHLDYHTFT